MPGLLGCKAAELQRGQAGHWDYFDCVQRAYLTGCANIVYHEVLERCAQDVGLNLVRFRRDIASPARNGGMEADMRIATPYGITSTPSIVVNESHLMSGAVGYEQVIDFLITDRNHYRRALRKRGITPLQIARCGTPRGSGLSPQGWVIERSYL